MVDNGEKGKSDSSLSSDETGVRFAPCRSWLFNITNKFAPYRGELFSKKTIVSVSNRDGQTLDFIITFLNMFNLKDCEERYLAFNHSVKLS